jgi:RecA/RadA recombinase
MSRLVRPQRKEGDYFEAPSTLEFGSSGCTLLDRVLGGGWARGRMANIIGDKSTAKTGLAIEAMASFKLRYPKAKAFYREAEGAFEKAHGREMGMPKDARFWADDHPERPLETIEDVFEDLDAILASVGTEPCIYVVDSLDALSDRSEMARKIDEGSYSLEKQKKLGQLFRRLVRKIEASGMVLIIISQVRDNIGVSFGEKHKRTGGKAMDFYASHCLWLSVIEQIKKTIGGQERVIGVQIRANCKKNKVGLPFRKCDMIYRFGYGIDDLETNLQWLKDTKKLVPVLGVADYKPWLAKAQKLDDEEYREKCADMAEVVSGLWQEIDKQFLPERRKYA